MLRLLKEDFACKNHQGRTEEMVELAGKVCEAYLKTGDYAVFLPAAKRLNKVYKELAVVPAGGHDDEHWEH